MALDRRGFLKFIGGATAGILATPVVWKSLDDVSIWTQNWSWIPRNIDGANSYVPTVSKLCPSAVGVKVRLVDGRPVRVLTNNDHPLGGGLSSIAAAEVQLLYSPSRMKRPLKRTADGAYVGITWEEAEAMLVEGLKKAKGGDKLAVISGDETGTVNELFTALAAEMGSKSCFIMPGEAQPAAKAWELMGGEGQVGYDIEKSDYVLAIGANVLETWGPVIRNRHAFRVGRPHGEAPAVRFAYAGPVQNNTAATADVWLAIRPGTEAVLALGLANLLIKAGATSPAADFADFKALAAKFTPEQVAAQTGVDAKRLAAVAQELAKAKRPLVIAGSEFGQGGGAAPVLAGLALNALLGSMNREGGIRALPYARKVVPAAMDRKALLQNDLVAWLGKVASGKSAAPQAVVFYEANPVYALPQADAMKATLTKVPFKVAFTSFLDETAMACDLVLPVPMGLERFDDVDTPYGCGQVVYALAVPALAPLVDARPAGDVVIGVAKKLGADLGVATFADALKAKAEARGASFTEPSATNAHVSNAVLPVNGIALRADVLSKAIDVKAPAFPVALAPVAKLNVGTSKTATPPFNTKTVRRWEIQGKELYVLMNGATAAKLGLRMHDRIELSNPAGKFTARVNLFEGVINDTVAVPAGHGHTAFDEFSKGKGENVMRLLAAGAEPGTGLSVWTSAGANIAKA
ncbi:molybdopterin-dependent oxidoreductase [Desulfovibrio oxamicus]|uniref:Molybdopterin-dependent oxidoreductase n=1 Tax=Nitratidesulfovibrio oxamicus TaxID=32016 RepID=A0ABS0J866_9BACT|nr:menaquinone reductase molybdopterin-binding-like subunit QrcB [Nitratidesulfovibrio oxamicus]MBG3878628.1 molybdopterin-dependent oxidoreductase [Nitratidesulfovibrio oxamicus]